MISVIVLTKNEAENIKECLQTVLWCDEIIVIDDNSTDETVARAKALGAMVYFHELAGNFAAQRNFGLEKAHGDWIFFLDADERVSPELKSEILQVMHARRNRYAGYQMKRIDHLWGKVLRHGETGSTTVVRLAKKGAGIWHGDVHETWKIAGHVGELSESINHYPHQTIREFLAEINTYTDIRARELHKQGVKSSWFSIILHTKGKFFQNYFLKLGLLDGIPGLLSAMMMTFHSFLVRSKLWLLWNKR